MMLNKAIDLAAESISGCVLQLYVWITNPADAGTFALGSILISALTTGFTSALIAFNTEVDVSRCKSQPEFYGYIPDDNGLRGHCFVLIMTLISTLHNLSRSVGCALIAATSFGRTGVLFFVGGEILLYLAYKLVRRDFFYWPRLGTKFAIILGLINRTVVKVVVDFSGCIHFRHPLEMGGLAFSISMVWAQAFPFLALSLFKNDVSSTTTGATANIEIFLLAGFALWMLLNLAFFCTINISYLHTFFGTKTAPQYIYELFLTSKEDSAKFRAVFKNRSSYTESIREDIQKWVCENIVNWREEAPSWFKIEMIPDDYLPREVFEAEGGANRRRSRVGEMIGLDERPDNGRVHPA